MVQIRTLPRCLVIEHSSVSFIIEAQYSTYIVRNITFFFFFFLVWGLYIYTGDTRGKELVYYGIIG